MYPAARPEDLAGEELSAVAFVRDYVELHFDGPVLRALVPPRVRDGVDAPRFPARGSRDALCALISRRVERLEVGEAAIIVHFVGGAEIEIPVSVRRDAAWTGPEWAHFVPGPNQPVQVW